MKVIPVNARRLIKWLIAEIVIPTKVLNGVTRVVGAVDYFYWKGHYYLIFEKMRTNLNEFIKLYKTNERKPFSPF